DIPTGTCIEANAHALARYAALCQEQGLVPMVEPEVLMDGSHDIETCYDVTEATLRALFNALYEHNVMLEGTILKASMVIAGKDCPEQADVEEVADMTVRCLRSAVPAALPGIVFLSGGQSDEQATAHLNAMNQYEDLPWPLSFSYGRAMQQAALKLWAADPAGNYAKAQQTVFERARDNGLAALGEWQGCRPAASPPAASAPARQHRATATSGWPSPFAAVPPGTTPPGGWRSPPTAFHPGSGDGRSEEHTSELQSRENHVCRPLLEKPK